ncbi:pilus assembly protein N-terminal domain-containing protein [uncultured Paludibaculum sp.]|uniref:type II and III secretion system protein family protein n=1 Tax=uncultured Paludibaculum sp. TaxID=1765020 RepID=UPI002AAB5498|nr:pilus assembly protein N-terminal domain-containing protein [uncultured Paludibaculum sp.]
MNRIVKIAIGSAIGLAMLVVSGGQSLRAQGGAEDIRVTLGKSVVIDYPEDVNRISTSNPEVVDYVPVSTREILLHAKGLGAATLVIWAKSGQRNFYNVNVEQNLEPTRKLIRDAFPREDIQVASAKDTISVTGTVSNQMVADRLMAYITPMAKSIVNNLKVRPAPIEKQVMLRVKFAELNRTYSNQFAVNLTSVGALNTVGSVGTGQFGSTRPSTIGGGSSDFSITDALNIFAFRPDLNLAAFVKLLQQQGMLQILAEPNLITSNGKEASFLVGGEFPVPVLQGGANSGSVTIQFREYGIRLTFNPTLTEHGTLKMYVKPEVSTIDLANAVSVSGFVIPALATRRVESNIELGPGQSFIIGGLVDDRTNEVFAKMPGLANIPLLGQLFRSRNENRQKTELIVLVTPELVEPVSASDQKLMPKMPGGFLDPMMLPNGMPQSSNAGSGAAIIKDDRQKVFKDAFKRADPAKKK